MKHRIVTAAQMKEIERAEGAAHADLTVTFDSYKPLHMAESSAPTLASRMNGTRSFDEGLPLRKIALPASKQLRHSVHPTL